MSSDKVRSLSNWHIEPGPVFGDSGSVFVEPLTAACVDDSDFPPIFFAFVLSAVKNDVAPTKIWKILANMTMESSWQAKTVLTFLNLDDYAESGDDLFHHVGLAYFTNETFETSIQSWLATLIDLIIRCVKYSI